MLVLILVLLLLAAAFGVLGAVLKAAIVIALSITLAVLFLVAFAYWWFRYRVNRFRRNLQRTSDDDHRWRQIRGDARDS